MATSLFLNKNGKDVKYTKGAGPAKRFGLRRRKNDKQNCFCWKG